MPGARISFAVMAAMRSTKFRIAGTSEPDVMRENHRTDHVVVTVQPSTPYTSGIRNRVLSARC